MPTRLAFVLIAAVGIVGCNTEGTPTPVPSNTPTPSPQDGKPPSDAHTRDSVPPTSDQSAAEEPGAKAPASADEPASSADSLEPDEPAAPPSSIGNAPPQPPVSADPSELVQKLTNVEQRDAVTRQLVMQGSAAVEPLMGALRSDDWQVRASAVFCLGQLGGEARSALPELQIIAENDEVPAVRDAAAFAMDAIKEPSNQ